MRLVEITGTKMPQTGDIVQYADYDGPDLVGSGRHTRLHGKQGQVLDTPEYLRQGNILRVMFGGRERASKINADLLTVIKPYRSL